MHINLNEKFAVDKNLVKKLSDTFPEMCFKYNLQ